MRLAKLAVPIIAAVVLSGCAPDAPPIVPTSAPTIRPVFASDEEALAAAKTAYTEHLMASDEVAHDGGRGLERLAARETPSELARDQKSFAPMRDAKQHVSGLSSFSSFRLQRAELQSNSKELVIAYACLDVSKTRLLDQSNRDITPDGVDVIPLQLTFESATTGSTFLLLDGSTTWSGSDFCSPSR